MLVITQYLNIQPGMSKKEIKEGLCFLLKKNIDSNIEVLRKQYNTYRVVINI